MLQTTKNFNDISSTIIRITNSRKDEYLDGTGHLSFNDFAEEGLSSAGSKFKFPPSFLKDLARKGHEDLCQSILDARYSDYFFGKPDNQLLVRSFDDRIYGVLSNRYSIFDDDEVLDLLSSNKTLMNSEEYWYDLSPSRLHLRFVSPQKVLVGNDDSSLSPCIFVDNSMTGNSSFKIRFGLYRWACTNGIIAGFTEFNLLKEVHFGKKDYSDKLVAILDKLDETQALLIDLVKKYQSEPAAIRKFGKDTESVMAYLKMRLNVNNKIATQIYEKYLIYGGETKWDLVNAITDVAHIVNLEDRVSLESKAMKIA